MKVITSEYARRMAHNLDDLRERWLLKKQSQNDVVKTKEPERFGVDYFFVPQKTRHIELFDQLSDINANVRKYKGEVDQIQAELSNNNVVDADGKRLNPRQYNAWREALKEELIYKKKLLRYIRYVEKAYHMNRDYLLTNGRYEDRKTELLKRCKKLFSKFAKDGRVIYTKSEQKTIDEIFAYMAQEFDPDVANVELDEQYKIGGKMYEDNFPTIL